jgi:hypothetical protein
VVVGASAVAVFRVGSVVAKVYIASRNERLESVALHKGLSVHITRRSFHTPLPTPPPNNINIIINITHFHHHHHCSPPPSLLTSTTSPPPLLLLTTTFLLLFLPSSTRIRSEANATVVRGQVNARHPA